jgi:hypothetical protein
VEEDGNAEAALFDEEPLDGVGQLGRFARVATAGGVTGAAHLPEAVAVAVVGAGLGSVKDAVLVEQQLGLLLPDARHLGSFLGERHAAE